MYKVTIVVPKTNAHILHAYLKQFYKDVFKSYIDYADKKVISFTYTSLSPFVTDVEDFGFFEIKITRLMPPNA